MDVEPQDVFGQHITARIDPGHSGRSCCIVRRNAKGSQLFALRPLNTRDIGRARIKPKSRGETQHVVFEGVPARNGYPVVTTPFSRSDKNLQDFDRFSDKAVWQCKRHGIVGVLGQTQRKIISEGGRNHDNPHGKSRQ